jgi:hypothetical protein
MGAREPATPREACVIAAITALAGIYFLLVGLAVLPVPGGPRNLHAPLWVVLLVGLVFLLAGLAVLVQVIGRANDRGDLPAQAPLVLHLAQYLIGVAIFGSFALIATWVTIGGDARRFSGTLLIFDWGTNVTIARSMFGLGAVMCWLATVAVAVSGARKLLGRRA